MKKKTIYKNKVRKECWDLHTYFFEWLKERLPIYLKDADKVVDLDYQTFEIGRRKFTQKEVIQMMIKDLDYITDKDVNDWSEEYYKKVNHLMECWSKVILAMWW